MPWICPNWELLAKMLFASVVLVLKTLNRSALRSKDGLPPSLMVLSRWRSRSVTAW